MTLIKNLTATIATVMIGGILVTVIPSESSARGCAKFPGLGKVCGDAKTLLALRGMTGAKKVNSGKRPCTGKTRVVWKCIKYRRDGRCARERKITRHGC